MNYKILCEDCKCELGSWVPSEGITYTEEDIIRCTQTGYICDSCMKIRQEAQDDGA
jgi:hypothetical protein